MQPLSAAGFRKTRRVLHSWLTAWTFAHPSPIRRCMWTCFELRDAGLVTSGMGISSPIKLRCDLPHHAAGTATAGFSASGCRSEQIAIGVDGYVAVGMGPVAATGKVV